VPHPCAVRRCHPGQPPITWLGVRVESEHHLDRRPDAQLTPLVTFAAPELVARPGIGVDTAGQLLVTAGDNPQRLRSEQSSARLCGVAPVPVSSGRTDRNRPHRGGDRDANSALWRIALVRMGVTSRPRITSPAACPAMVTTGHSIPEARVAISPTRNCWERCRCGVAAACRSSSSGVLSPTRRPGRESMASSMESL
jgi:hypothetical protein